MPDNALLRTMLAVAVPFWVERLKRVPFSKLLERAPELGQFIAEKGDILQFKSKKKAESGEAFNKFAEAITILSFMPGGVEMFGDRYEHTHPDMAKVPQ